MADETNAPEGSHSENLPAKQNRPSSPPSPETLHLIETAVREFSISSRSGPLPDPREFAAYNEILPGAAERILRMAEKQSDHRMEMEKAVISGDIANERHGLVAGVVTVISTLILTGYLAHVGLGAWGIAVVLAEIAGIVYSVRHITNKNAEEREHKAKIQHKLDERQQPERDEESE